MSRIQKDKDTSIEMEPWKKNERNLAPSN